MAQTWDIIKSNYMSPKEVIETIPHKDTAKFTTSKKFKYDVLETFNTDDYKDKTIVEIGASQGISTYFLSYLFKNVYSVEWDDWNLEEAKKRCMGRSNVNFIKFDLYSDSWDGKFPKNADVVFVDAGHQYDQVKSDIENCLKYFDNPTFVFDDYGLPPGEVKKAIDEKISDGILRIDKFIGETADNLVHANNTKFFDMEGCICNLT
jgi:predicted O-methyltransferase YrrM